jgi:hypothetical protein
VIVLFQVHSGIGLKDNNEVNSANKSQTIHLIVYFLVKERWIEVWIDICSEIVTRELVGWQKVGKNKIGRLQIKVQRRTIWTYTKSWREKKMKKFI